jgi:predicted nucleic acid-binding protein
MRIVLDTNVLARAAIPNSGYSLCQVSVFRFRSHWLGTQQR